MSGISIHYALDLIEDCLGIYRTKKANATTRVHGVLGGIKALQALLNNTLANIDRLGDENVRLRKALMQVVERAVLEEGTTWKDTANEMAQIAHAAWLIR